eukprot:216531-Rhodomonas_salina.5
MSRCAELENPVVKTYGSLSVDCMQGDEPLVSPQHIDLLVQHLHRRFESESHLWGGGGVMLQSVGSMV